MPPEPPLIELLDRLVPDSWRASNPFTDDLRQCHDSLVASSSDGQRADLLGEWLTSNQPCLFGQEASRNKHIEYCFITHQDLAQGDDHVGSVIARARLRWRR